MKAAITIVSMLLSCAGWSLEIDSGAKDHPVASRLAGVWHIDADITQKLGAEEVEGRMEVGFEADDSVLQELPVVLAKKIESEKLPIYLAGKVIMGAAQPRGFLLTGESGGLSVHLFAHGDEAEVETLSLVLVRGASRAQDRLFLAKHGEVQVTTAFRRAARKGAAWDEIEISVPEVATPEREVGEIIVNVKTDGTIVVEGQEQSAAKLLESLSIVAKNYKDQAVILRGDRETSFKHIVAVLNICQQAGIWNVAFATTRPKPVENLDTKLKKTLPEASPSVANQHSLRIEIAKNGSLRLDGQAVSLAQLEKKLAATKKQTGGKLELVLSAHDEGKSERFVEVINLLGKLRISNITMAGFREEAE